MNRTSPRALVIGAALSAILRAVGMNVVNVEQTKHGHRIPRPLPASFSAWSPNKSNGGQRRKNAIRAARMRKFGRERFGRYR